MNTRFLNRGLLLAGLAVTVAATMTATASASDGGSHDRSWDKPRDGFVCAQYRSDNGGYDGKQKGGEREGKQKEGEQKGGERDSKYQGGERDSKQKEGGYDSKQEGGERDSKYQGGERDSKRKGSGYDRGRDGLTAVGLTVDQKLVVFNVAEPEKAEDIGRVADGLRGDKYLVGIDYRVQDGDLYGVGNAGGIYVLDPCEFSATKVSQLTVALKGKFFGVDFNPAADRLRVISDQGQNLRHDVNPGGVTIVDGALTYPPASGTAKGLTGAAYTNNDLDPATATTLFDIDTNLDQVVIQSPANSGQLAATGQLGVNAGGNAGFDIYSTVRDGRTVDVQGFAVLDVKGHHNLYKVNILTGEADKKGEFPRQYQVVDLALPLNQL